MTARVGADGRWLRRFSPAPDARRRLVCFPHAGGAAGAFHAWAHALAPRVDVLAVQYPGRQNRYDEPAASSVGELADGVVGALGALDAHDGWTDRPYALFGHSMGASVAFEVARTLHARGSGPVKIILSGRGAPPPAPEPGWRHLLGDDDLRREMTELGGTVPGVLDDPELARLLLPVVRGDYRVAETYWAPPEAIVPCPIAAMIGADDPLVTPEQARGWRRHTSGDFELHVLPGHHFYLDADRDAVLRRIDELLQDVGS